MITLLRPGYAKIMALFYAEKNARLHLREIARKARLHEPSTTRFLGAMKKERLLTSERDGNQKKYAIVHSQKTYACFMLFDLQRLNSLPNIRKNAIRHFLGRLQERPVTAVLFGSTAKGTFKADSDIDLLLITNRKIETKEAEKNAEALTGIRISVFQITLQAFLKEIKLQEDHVIQSAIATGYPVINNIAYYGLIYHGPEIPP